MKLNPFTVDQSILTEEEMLHIENKLVESIYYETKARSLFPIRSIGSGGGKMVYRFYDEEMGGEAQISMTDKASSMDSPEKTHHDKNVPVVSKDFFINWRELAASRTQGPGLMEDCVRTCARRIAEAEDRMLISGEYTGWAAEGAEGLFGATGRTNNASIGAWPVNALADINVARAALADAGFSNVKPTVVGTSAVIQTLDGFVANTAITYRQAFLDAGVVGEFVETPNAYAQDGGQDSVVVCVPGESNFYAVTDLPLEVHYWYDMKQNVYGVARETIAPIIGHALAIAEISAIP